jgi:hypothetical protein
MVGSCEDCNEPCFINCCEFRDWLRTQLHGVRNMRRGEETDPARTSRKEGTERTSVARSVSGLFMFNSDYLSALSAPFE